MTVRRSEPLEPLAEHTRDFYARLNELRYRHPHIPVHELKHFLNRPPSFDAPAKPAPEEPKERSIAKALCQIGNEIGVEHGTRSHLHKQNPSEHS
jgi:hypothetical protein